MSSSGILLQDFVECEKLASGFSPDTLSSQKDSNRFSDLRQRDIVNRTLLLLELSI